MLIIRLLLLAILLAANTAFAQEPPANGTANGNEEVDLTMETPEDYERLAPLAMKIFDWLYQSPVGQEAEKRQQFNAFLLQWVSGTPTVSIMISEEIVPYMKDVECLMIFMGAYSNHALQAEEQDATEATYYATQHVLDFYDRNKKALGRNKEIEKLAKLEKENNLKKYIKDNMPKG